jgi:hypothetical protein
LPKGKSYPTVNLDAIHQALFNISSEIVKHIRFEIFGLSEMVVPLSMALLTIYDEEYLGIESVEKKGDAVGEKDNQDDE